MCPGSKDFMPLYPKKDKPPNSTSVKNQVFKDVHPWVAGM